MNSDLGNANGSFWVEIRDAEHVNQWSWKRRPTRVCSHQLTYDIKRRLLFWKRLQWSCLKVFSVPTFVLEGLRVSTATSGFCQVCVCVIVVTIRRWADVGLWAAAAVCVLAKISFCGPTATFARLTQSQAISHSRAFSSLSERWEIRTSFTFFHFFETLFRIIIASFTIVIKRSPNKQSAGGRSASKSTCSSGVSSERGVCFFLGSVQAGDRINWPLTLWDVYLLGNACNGRVWKQFRCLPLSEVACGAPPPPAALVRCLCVRVCHRGHYKALSRCRFVGSCARPGKIFFFTQVQTPVTLCSGEWWSILVVRLANSADLRSRLRHVSSAPSVAYSTGCSRVLTHPGTNPARRCLTSCRRPSAYDHVCTLNTVTGNLAVNSVFITVRSIGEMNKFHFFYFFDTLSYNYVTTVFFTTVIKRSAGGESQGGGRSTSKSTCVVRAWTLTSENASFWGLWKPMIASTDLWPQICLPFRNSFLGASLRRAPQLRVD